MIRLFEHFNCTFHKNILSFHWFLTIHVVLLFLGMFGYAKRAIIWFVAMPISSLLVEFQRNILTIQALHSLELARLVAHPWKNLKFSMAILTFIAIPNEFWKIKVFVWSSVSQLSHKMGQIWSNKIRAQFLCFSNICDF